MKTKYITLSVIVTLILNYQNVLAICTNSVTTYTNHCESGECGFYSYAAYSDGSRPPQSVSGGTLTVTWNHSGTGYIDVVIVNALGEQFEIHSPVTITDCLSFTTHPSLMCNSNSSLFSVSDTNGSTSYTWTVPSGWSINGGGNVLTTSSTSANITSASTGNGTYTISVSGNASGAKSTTVWVGPPSASINTLIYPTGMDGIDPVTLHVSTTYSFFTEFVSGATSYNWTLPSGFTYGPGSHTTSPVKIVTPSSAGSGYALYCQVVNSCGSAYTHNLQIIVSATGGGGPIQRVAADIEQEPADDSFSGELDMPFPNPANQKITVALSLPSKLAIMNSNGIIGNEFDGEGIVTLPVQSLTNGIYFLTITNKSQRIVKKLLIMH
jgi:hypothetical protein